MAHYTFLLPILVRIACMIAIPTGHYLFHKFMHASIHATSHRVKAVNQLIHRFKYLPDIIMVLALVAVHYFTE